MAKQGQVVAQEGKKLTPEEGLDGLTRQAAEFEAKQIPQLKALQII